MQELVRTQVLLGDNYPILRRKTILIVGLGGVGSHAAEALIRMGIGRLILVDFDDLAVSNSNRHVQSRSDRIGRNKAQAMKEHIVSVLPEADITVIEERYCRETEDLIFNYPIDGVIDAIDIMTNKLQLIQACLERHIPFVSSMGMANRTDPLAVYQTSIYKTEGDRFAAIIRRHARSHGWPDFPVVTSREVSSKHVIDQAGLSRHVPASCYLVPAAGGLALADWICKNMVNYDRIE